MIKKQVVQRTHKSYKSQKSQEDGCSRVGLQFQVEIPEYIGPVMPSSALNDYSKEFNVWTPEKEPNHDKLENYLKTAKNYQYSQELALILLHWHDYNIENATDDLPNYVPASNKWTKSEVRKFLKCIDSKPRKNFVEAKKTVPGRHMGDVCALYYSIAAPFKARTRNKYHNELIDQCFSRALRAGLITNRWKKFNYYLDNPLSDVQTNLIGRRPGLAEDPLEREIELHLIDLVGINKAGHLLTKELLCTPYPFLNNHLDQIKLDEHKSTLEINTTISDDLLSNAVINSNMSVECDTTNSNNYQTSSSDGSSQVDGEFTCQGQSSRFVLPNGIHYNHEEFLSFITASPSQLTKEQNNELARLENVKTELYSQIPIVDARARSLLNKMELLKPAEGFPQISYRWTQTELALVLTAMSKYGRNFAKIAHTIGTKSENFIHDFYNQCNDRFGLDQIMRLNEQTNISPNQNEKSKIKSTESIKFTNLNESILHSEQPIKNNDISMNYMDIVNDENLSPILSRTNSNSPCLNNERINSDYENKLKKIDSDSSMDYVLNNQSSQILGTQQLDNNNNNDNNHNDLTTLNCSPQNLTDDQKHFSPTNESPSKNQVENNNSSTKSSPSQPSSSGISRGRTRGRGRGRGRRGRRAL